MSQPQTLSVSSLARQARLLLEERFNIVWVTGEISNFVRPRSGHWYFSLKDSQAQIRCAMFANRNRGARIQPTDGTQVLIRGRVSLYEGRGDFQIIVDHIEAAGEGQLRQAFEQLKIKLHNEGLFAETQKQAMPAIPSHIAVITSPSGAAIKDVLSVWQRRMPLLKVSIVPSAVQGEQAEGQLIEALDQAHTLAPDAILLTRGGGSLEDLWVFNSEQLSRAIHAAAIPVVSAIGHEIDTTIADLVADLRAPTPSAAAELLVPDIRELKLAVGSYEDTFVQQWSSLAHMLQLNLNNLALRLGNPQQHLQQAQLRLDDSARHLQYATQHHLTDLQTALAKLISRLDQQQPSQQVRILKLRCSQLSNQLTQAIKQQHLNSSTKIAHLAQSLNLLSPLPTLQRGFSVSRDKDNQVVSTTEQLQVGDNLTTIISDGRFQSQVTHIHPGETLDKS